MARQRTLVLDQWANFRLDDHIVLEADILDYVASFSVPCDLDYMVVVIER